jgi:hypothetical protein
MKKAIYLLAILNMVFVFPTKAQRWVGFRGGISIPNLTAGGNPIPLNTGYSSRRGPDIGIFSEFIISPSFSLQPMIEYLHKEVKYS